MSKTVQKKPVQNKQNTKKKLPEVEDFFTVFIQKKNRNVEKKIKHIQELEIKLKDSSNTKTELTKEQQDLVNKRPELEKQIAHNNEIRDLYFEAYSKKEETAPVTKPEEPKKEDPEVPKINEEEVENRGVAKAVRALTRFMFVSQLLKNQESVAQFSSVSGLSGLDDVLELFRSTQSGEGDNFSK